MHSDVEIDNDVVEIEEPVDDDNEENDDVAPDDEDDA